MKYNKINTPIEWIFFDVGSTLVDETKAYIHRVYDMIDGTDIHFEEFEKKRVELSSTGKDGNIAAISFFNLTKTPWHSEDETLYDGVHEILSYLRDKGYNLGIIANQNKGLCERLSTWDIRKYFDIVISSSDFEYAKPELKIFEIAITKSNTNAEKCVMIGDRIDNDIIPAKVVGMKTVWIKSGFSAIQDDKICGKNADAIVYTLNDLKEIF